jgi:aldose 1-epimerase
MSSEELATVRLCDADAGLEATFVPGANMLCCSLRHHGEELLAQNAGVAAYAARGKTMGIPLLYPWANRLAGFDFSVAGRTVTVPHDPVRIALDGNGLPIHGVIGGRLAWELDGAPVQHVEYESVEAIEGGQGEAIEGGQGHAAPGQAAVSLTAHLSWSNAEPGLFEVFPFRHDLTYRARLAAGRLEIELTVDACGADVVPIAFGFHPYLCLPGAPREDWQIELPTMRGLQLDSAQIPVACGEMFHAWCLMLGESVFDDGFESVAEPARFAATAGGRRISLELPRGYPCAQIYSPAGAQFICFEPMTAPANALRSGRGLRLLSPGERFSAAFAVSVEDLSPSG